LRDEEAAVRAARAAADGVNAALRGGDMSAVVAAQPELEALADRLRDASTARTPAAEALAAAVGLPVAGLNLSALAARLPDPLATELRAARDGLSAAARDLADIQRRNANLARHLRSYFRGVLSAFAAPDRPSRYGPAGTMVAPR
jgi:hypothetical protein